MHKLIRSCVIQRHQTYFEHLESMGFTQDEDYFWSTSEQKLSFYNGSEILFRHFDEPNKLKSLNLGFVEIEEMSDIPYDTFKMLLARLRQKIYDNWKLKDFRYRIFGHTNPEIRQGWIYKTFFINPAPQLPPYHSAHNSKHIPARRVLRRIKKTLRQKLLQYFCTRADGAL